MYMLAIYCLNLTLCHWATLFPVWSVCAQPTHAVLTICLHLNVIFTWKELTAVVLGTNVSAVLCALLSVSQEQPGKWDLFFSIFKKRGFVVNCGRSENRLNLFSLHFYDEKRSSDALNKNQHSRLPFLEDPLNVQSLDQSLRLLCKIFCYKNSCICKIPKKNFYIFLL